MSMPPDVENQVRALETMNLEGLRAVWRRSWGPPPSSRAPGLLRPLIAWRIQADATGGLDGAIQRSLKANSVKIKAPPLRPGTHIVREWQGVRHEVEVVDDGYAYGGALHKSLSSVARQITGVRWNGPRFFGLRDEAQG